MLGSAFEPYGLDQIQGKDEFLLLEVNFPSDFPLLAIGQRGNLAPELVLVPRCEGVCVVLLHKWNSVLVLLGLLRVVSSMMMANLLTPRRCCPAKRGKAPVKLRTRGL